VISFDDVRAYPSAVFPYFFRTGSPIVPMARVVRDPRIDTRSARLRLGAQREPYWRKIAHGRYLGYRRAREGGSWIARWRDPAGRQHYRKLGAADDVLDAN